MTSPSSASDLSDRDLLAELERAVTCERHATAQLIALLMEVDSRKLYAGQGYSSLFMYCVQRLHLSEHAAYLRIEAARLARRFPIILDRLSDGSLHLTAVSLLGPHLTAENHLELLDSARHMSKREVEVLIARLRPQPDVPSIVRKLPVAQHVPVPGSAFPVLVPGSRVRRFRLPIQSARYCRPRRSTTSRDQTARARALQGAMHCVARNVRQAAARAGFAASHDPQRRSLSDPRSRAHAAAG